MPSSILNALSGLTGVQNAAPAIPANLQNILGNLNQFRQSIGAFMGAGNPEQAARAILRQRGLDPDAVLRQFGNQATEIQRQLAGMR